MRMSDRSSDVCSSDLDRRTRRPRAVPHPRRRGRRAARRLPAGAAMSTVFDPRQVRRAFSRASGTYEASAALQREVEARLLESLDYLEDRAPDTAPEIGRAHV